MSAKGKVRKQMRERLAGQREAAQLAASAAVCAHLRASEPYRVAGALALYCAVFPEVDLAALAAHASAHGKVLFYPRYEGPQAGYAMARVPGPERLRPGHMGIPEPAADAPVLGADTLPGPVLWLIPALAFDRQGARLGRGGGYYDRMLANAAGARVGIGYDWQVVDRLPTAAHDVMMHAVCTPAAGLRQTPFPPSHDNSEDICNTSSA